MLLMLYYCVGGVCYTEDLSDESMYQMSQSQPQSSYQDTSTDEVHSFNSIYLSYSPFKNQDLNTNSQDDQNLEPGLTTCRVLVEKERLLQLFRVCSEPSCKALIDPQDVKYIEIGAAVNIHAVCLNNHSQTWCSSSTVGEGNKRMYVVNIVLAAFTLFCGLNISQVS